MILTEFKIDLQDSVKRLNNSRKETLEFFDYGNLSIKLYKPDKIDKQKPYVRDKAYIIASGSGTFVLNGEKSEFESGDFFFVPTGMDHYFENFTDDFITWVLYCGYDCGEIYY